MYCIVSGYGVLGTTPHWPVSQLYMTVVIDLRKSFAENRIASDL